MLTTFLWTAYVRVQATLVRATGNRAQAAADHVATLLDGQRTIDQIRQVARDRLLIEFVTSRTEDTREAARRRLTGLIGTTLRRMELWDAAGSRLLEVSSGPALPPASFPLVAGIHELRQSNGVVFSDTVAELGDGAASLGFLVIRSTFVESPPGIFNRLVGGDAAVRIANQRGDVWSTITSAAPPLPVNLARPGIVQYRAANGEMRIGAAAHVRATPWAVWVEFPLATAVAPAHEFLRWMIPVAVLFLAAGTLVVSILSARITRPLSDLSDATEAIAAGDYSRRVEAGRPDEIGRLSGTFNAMAGEIQEAQHRLEARVAERTAQLEAANNELEAFSYSVSHDLRAPLRSIDGFSQALLEAHTLDETQKGHLQRVRAAAQRMGQLIDDLLKLSRVGRAPLDRYRANLSEIGLVVANELRRGDPERQVEVDIQDGLVADADRGLVQIVLENLLGNAWKFTRNATPSALIRFGAEAGADGEQRYFIRDNGAGFDMSYAAKLFRPFQRLHNIAEFPGTGIGLATVRRIVERHGGRVWGEGEVGRGATMYFTLPSSDSDAPTRSASGSSRA
ncbi:MAG TPA: ATP-binding protein [Vicinamibacterales bacterium]|nr:ATP-binding protein [Vicinamibacterales bacterium]